MKLTINKESFSRVLSHVNKSVSLRPATPVLGNVLISAEKGMVSVQGTNLETTLIVRVPAKVEDTGETTVPARLLAELLGSIKDDKISVELKSENLEIKTPKLNSRMATIDPTEFPKPPKIKGGKGEKIEKESFVETVIRVGVAASQDEGRPVLNGILFKPGTKGTQVVATDGYRLAKKETTKLISQEIIIPARGLVEIGRVLGSEDDETIDFSVSEEENQAVFSTRHLSYFTKLISGEYPNFEQIIPDNFVTTVVVDKSEFLDSLKIAFTFAKELGNVVNLIFKPHEEALLKASSSQVGDSEVSFRADTKGQELKIAFNSRYLSEGINSILGDKVEIRLAGSVNPAILKSPDDDSFIYVVMPVRPQS